MKPCKKLFYYISAVRCLDAFFQTRGPVMRIGDTEYKTADIDPTGTIINTQFFCTISGLMTDVWAFKLFVTVS